MVTRVDMIPGGIMVTDGGNARKSVGRTRSTEESMKGTERERVWN